MPEETRRILCEDVLQNKSVLTDLLTAADQASRSS